MCDQHFEEDMKDYLDRAAHGWCPPDSAVYNQAQAERAWSRLLVLFGKALA